MSDRVVVWLGWCFLVIPTWKLQTGARFWGLKVPVLGTRPATSAVSWIQLAKNPRTSTWVSTVSEAFALSASTPTSVQIWWHLTLFCPVPPSIKGGNTSTDVTALLDTVVTLECEGRGVPPPTVTWYRNGQAMLSNPQTQYVERGHFLKILQVQASDAGTYTCKVSSVAGSTEKTFELDVYCKNLALCLKSFIFHCALSLSGKALKEHNETKL